MNITRRKYTSFHQNFQEFDKKLIANAHSSHFCPVYP